MVVKISLLGTFDPAHDFDFGLSIPQGCQPFVEIPGPQNLHTQFVIYITGGQGKHLWEWIPARTWHYQNCREPDGRRCVIVALCYMNCLGKCHLGPAQVRRQGAARKIQD